VLWEGPYQLHYASLPQGPVLQEIDLTDGLQYGTDITAVCMTPEADIALVGDSGGGLRVWSLESGDLLRLLDGHEDSVWLIRLTPDGRHVLSGGWDRTLRLWEIETGRCIHVMPHADAVWSAAVTPDGTHAVVGDRGGTLRVWNLGSGCNVRTVKAHVDEVASVQLSPDGSRVLSFGGEKDRQLKLWNLGGMGRRQRWRVDTNCEYSFRHDAQVMRASILPDGRRAVSQDNSGAIYVWNLATGQRVSNFEIQGLSPMGISRRLHPTADGLFLFSSGEDKLLVWSLETGRCIRELEGHRWSVSKIALSPDQRRILSIGGQTLRVWELEWEFEFPEPVDWDEGARPYLETFLTLHTSYDADGLTRRGTPAWSEEECQQLLTELGHHGYGWLRPEGVRNKLEEMAGKLQ
jgi:WD40 repeat protein